jgi:hypothetical protein
MPFTQSAPAVALLPDLVYQKRTATHKKYNKVQHTVSYHPIHHQQLLPLLMAVLQQLLLNPLKLQVLFLVLVLQEVQVQVLAALPALALVLVLAQVVVSLALVLV